MKFGKITSKNVSSNAIALGGALGGSALSGGLLTLVPEEQKLIARGGTALLSVLAASSMKGSTAPEKLVQFAFIGMAIKQGQELIKEVSQDSIQVDANSSGGDKFVAGMAGLACPCDNATAALRAAPVISFNELQEGEQRSMPKIEQTYQPEVKEETLQLESAF